MWYYSGGGGGTMTMPQKQILVTWQSVYEDELGENIQTPR